MVFLLVLKAETLEDLYEWKTALESALAQAPNAALVMGQNGIFKNDQNDGTDCSNSVDHCAVTCKFVLCVCFDYYLPL